MASNRFEEKARAEKAGRLYGTARSLHVTASAVANSDQVRSLLVERTGVRNPSDATWAMVVSALESAEKQDAQVALRKAQVA